MRLNLLYNCLFVTLKKGADPEILHVLNCFIKMGVLYNSLCVLVLF